MHLLLSIMMNVLVAILVAFNGSHFAAAFSLLLLYIRIAYGIPLTDVNYAEDISSLVTAVIRARRTSNRCSEQGQSGHVAGHRSHQQARRRCNERHIRCDNGRCGRRVSVSGGPDGDGRGSNVRVSRDATATARADMKAVGQIRKATMNAATGGGGYYRKLFESF